LHGVEDETTSQNMKNHSVTACLLGGLFCGGILCGEPAAETPAAEASAAGKIAAKPLFRDPVYDGAADPTVIWNRAEKKWFIFYTNRRANASEAEAPGVSWVHGTRIGIAESADGGATWKYRGTADIDYGGKGMTHWAPEVLYHEGLYHMYLTFVPGIFTDWQHPREILHLTSADLLKWKYEGTLKLACDRVIDACVYRLLDGTWRLWYNHERDNKSIYFADRRDLNQWEDRGKVAGVGERPARAPTSSAGRAIAGWWSMSGKVSVSTGPRTRSTGRCSLATCSPRPAKSRRTAPMAVIRALWSAAIEPFASISSIPAGRAPSSPLTKVTNRAAA
jgi:hypothetical protein